jgi:hypothetical protein
MKQEVKNAKFGICKFGDIRPGRIAFLAGICCLLMVSGCPRIGTRDVGSIEVRCSPVTFVVSLNDDDDNYNFVADHQQGIQPATEDNLREFKFNHPKAAEVFIGEPVIIRGGTSALGTRVRAYQADKSTAFDFSKNHKVPVTMYLEGIGRSTRVNDIGFEYQYFRADGTTLCGPGATGTVVDVDVELSGINRGNPKLLALGRTSSRVYKTPKIRSTYEWSYDGDGLFRNPTRARTRFTAGRNWTPANQRDSQMVRCKLEFPTAGNCVIQSYASLNVTAPRRVRADRTGTIEGGSSISTVRIVNDKQARQSSFHLFRWGVNYTILDQFGNEITQSHRGGAHVTTREDVPIHSAIPSGIDDLEAWLRSQIPLHTSVNWRRNNDGLIEDTVHLAPPVSTIVRLQQGRLRLIPRTFGQDVVTMNGHAWFVSVNGDQALSRQVTNNSLRVHVIGFGPDPPGERVDLQSEYTVILP